MKPKSSLEAIREACRVVGGQAAMSRSLGVSSPTVNQWTTGTRQIPAERCLEIEKATAGTVTCEELRPDIDWAYLRGVGIVKINGTASNL
ncbi:transcriptional regulator [Klebsiella michiganensis]|uniref:transcriptional regulator n=1 Tax=Raoultella ornithinolytica TaxID=54291 RepID=UPI00259F05EC|nr:helix-turn-helix domain-containing protein [Klebsiella michiganensis]HBQ8590171.1 helix-turn-helix domain-containing protein [Klebsiella pneumoniae]